ncbi:MAG TPA: hypothetical protein DHV62_03695, partial [Elusimicrobia bacterium]|nr:hypothetical protein [Elusimicrobiota bacterium]
MFQSSNLLISKIYPEEIKLPKEAMNLHFQDADIREVFRLFALKSGINIIYGDEVKGTITIHLDNVPFDQALNTVLTLRGLTYQTVGTNILRILTPEMLTLERAKAITFTKIYPLNYAKADEVKTQLDAIRTAEGRKGITNVDTRTNSLIITDTPEGLESAEKLIKELDKKPYQVMIEAKMVDVKLNDLDELGISWAYKEGDTAVAQQTVYPAGVGTSGQQIVQGENLEVSAKLTTPASGAIFSFGRVTDRLRLEAKLGALITEGKTKVLATPRVATLNNKEAKILIDDKIPYKTTTVGTGGVSQENWQFLEAGVKLTVTPTVNEARQIILKVKPEVSVPTGGGGGVPPQVGTREAEVTVMVNNNETLVIGGLIRETDITNLEKIPFLGELPLLGTLFKYRSDSKSRSELLVFLR